MQRVFLVGLLGIVLTAACAHAGFRVIVRNDDPNVSLVRFSFEGGYGDFVYESPAGSIGSARQGTGEWRGTVDFLASDCTVVNTISLRAVGDVLVQVSSAGTTATNPFTPSTDVPSLVESERCIRR